jgi:hypothetical protein
MNLNRVSQFKAVRVQRPSDRRRSTQYRREGAVCGEDAMQVEVTWTVPAAAAPRAGPARRHRDGHARRGRRAAAPRRRRAARAAVVSGYVRYLNWFLFWSRCETGMSAIHAFCDFIRSFSKRSRRYETTGRAAPVTITQHTQQLRVGSTGSETRGRPLDSRGARCYDPCRRACNPSCDPSRSVHTRARGPRGAIAYASAARRAVGARHLK